MGELALAGDRVFAPGLDKVHVLDANTLEKKDTLTGFFQAVDSDVHDGALYVADVSRAPKGQMEVRDLTTGQHRTIHGEFGEPVAVNIHQGRIYVLESAENDTADSSPPLLEKAAGAALPRGHALHHGERP